MQTYRRLLALLVLVLATNAAQADTFGTGANQFSIDFVSISAATNPGSGLPAGPNFIFTGVHNDYRMGTYEITNDQWNKFVAAYGTVTGNPLNAYDTTAYYTGTHVPTNHVSWYEAARFVNWLNTSTGHQAAYKFTVTPNTSDYTFAAWSTTDTGYNAGNPYRNKEAFYFLPTEHEWVKAAYWSGTTLQPYATKAGESLFQGNGTNGGWNYYDGDDGPDGPLDGPWDVGSGSQELNGTYDMMGNAIEWTESPYIDPNFAVGSQRAIRGGAFLYYSDTLAASSRGNPDPTWESIKVGFRVASVPEPGCLTLLVAALAGLLCWKLRR